MPEDQTNPPPPALPNERCPLCGGPNGCVPAACGDLNAACWCRNATFSAELLARVPAPLRGLSCICARCASHALESETDATKKKAC